MFEQNGTIFEGLRRIDKAYRKYFQAKLAEYQFTSNEITVILFLYNNAPELDTASDISRCKGISKGLIARSVESLCKRGYLEAVRDGEDRRLIHLRLQDADGKLTKALEKAQTELEREVETGISAEHLKITRQTINQLLSNTDSLLN